MLGNRAKGQRWIRKNQSSNGGPIVRDVKGEIVVLVKESARMSMEIIMRCSDSPESVGVLVLIRGIVKNKNMCVRMHGWNE